MNDIEYIKIIAVALLLCGVFLVSFSVIRYNHLHKLSLKNISGAKNRRDIWREHDKAQDILFSHALITLIGLVLFSLGFLGVFIGGILR